MYINFLSGANSEACFGIFLRIVYVIKNLSRLTSIFSLNAVLIFPYSRTNLSGSSVNLKDILGPHVKKILIIRISHIGISVTDQTYLSLSISATSFNFIQSVFRCC